MTSLVANTAEEKRTPTPWPAPLFQGEADEDSNIVYCDDDQPFIVAECVTDAGYTHQAEAQFAAFIVLACNSFDALTEANARYRRALEQVLISVGHGDAKDIAQRALKYTGAK